MCGHLFHAAHTLSAASVSFLWSKLLEFCFPASCFVMKCCRPCFAYPVTSPLHASLLYQLCNCPNRRDRLNSRMTPAQSTFCAQRKGFACSRARLPNLTDCPLARNSQGGGRSTQAVKAHLHCHLPFQSPEPTHNTQQACLYHRSPIAQGTYHNRAKTNVACMRLPPKERKGGHGSSGAAWFVGFDAGGVMTVCFRC